MYCWLDRIHRSHGRHLLLVGLFSLTAAATIRRLVASTAAGRSTRLLKLLNRLTDQWHSFAIGRHHQQRGFRLRVRNGKAVLKHLNIAGLLSVEILRRLDSNFQTENRPQLPDGLGMSVVDHERPQPPLEQVGILSLRQVELGVQGGRFDPVVTVADPLDVDLAEDRQVGTLVRLIQPRKFPVRSRISEYSEGRTNVPDDRRGPGTTRATIAR